MAQADHWELEQLLAEADRIRGERDDLARRLVGVARANAEAVDFVCELERVRAELKHKNESLELALGGAEQVLRDRARFVTQISEEFQGPIDDILAAARVLLGTDAPGAAEQQRLAEVVQDGGLQLSSLLARLLDAARPDARTFDAEALAFDPRSLCTECLELRARDLQGAETVLNFKAPGRLPSPVTGNPLRLRQVLDNLLRNALAFTEQGVVELELRAKDRGRGSIELDFLVRDTGVGMDAGALQEVRQAIAGGAGPQPRREGADGVGVYVAAQLVRLLGGRLGVSSTRGQGTEFSFSLPVLSTLETRWQAEGEIQPEQRSRPRAPIRPRSVAVLDSSSEVRGLIGLLLRDQGFEACGVDSWEELLDQLAGETEGGPDLLVVDLAAVPAGGAGLRSALDMRGYEVPVLGLLSEGAPQPAEPERYGCAELIQKPFDGRLFLEQVRGVVHSATPGGPG